MDWLFRTPKVLDLPIWSFPGWSLMLDRVFALLWSRKAKYPEQSIIGPEQDISWIFRTLSIRTFSIDLICSVLNQQNTTTGARDILQHCHSILQCWLAVLSIPTQPTRITLSCSSHIIIERGRADLTWNGTSFLRLIKYQMLSVVSVKNDRRSSLCSSNTKAHQQHIKASASPSRHF